MKYSITLKREIWNTLLHILIGAVIAYLLVPVYGRMIIYGTMVIIAGLRELLQYLRKKEQPLYIHIIDVLSFVVGGELWYQIREIFNINADIL